MSKAPTGAAGENRGPGAYDLERARRDLPALREWVYLGTGSYGLMPEPVLAAHLARVAAGERGGQAALPLAQEEFERCRRRVAALLGVPAEQVALNRNASDGIAWVTGAIELSPADEVLTSDVEGVEVLAALAGLRERTGATIRFVPLAPEPDRFAAAVRAAASPRTRLVLLSHVSAESGVRAPLAVVRDAVGPDAFFLVDAAQSLGVVPVEPTGWRADAVIGNGHKWLGGPKGTGFAWFAPGAAERLRPLGVGVGGVEPWSIDRAYYQREPMPPAAYRPEPGRRFEFGTLAWHHYGGLADAIDYQGELGWAAIEDHIRDVTGYAKARIAAIPGLRVATPTTWSESAGFVSFAVPGREARELSRRLREEERVIQRPARVPGEEHGVVRVSCACFTSREDIDRLVEALGRLTGRQATGATA